MRLPLGIMLGRFTSSKGRGIQFFPHGEGEWKKEFDIARELGLSHIEWVWDASENPLLDADFRAKVRARIVETHVPVKGVDLQFLTKHDVAGVSDDSFSRICEAMAEINGVAVEPPLLECSSLLDAGMREKRVERLAKLVEIAKGFGLSVNLETDLPPSQYRAILESMPDLGVCYDSGNSHHFGYGVSEEWEAYGGRIRNVQIKDRPLGGSTVALGTGGTDFRAVFKKMKERSYTGLVTLQAARGEDGKERETITQYMKFIQEHALL
jgi:hexulose-6-phosphate isomerase